MKLHGKNILKCISNNVVSQRRSLKEFGMHCYAFRNVVSQRRSLKEFGMHCYAFRNVVSQRRSLKKEFRMYWFCAGLNPLLRTIQGNDPGTTACPPCAA